MTRGRMPDELMESCEPTKRRARPWRRRWLLIKALLCGVAMGFWELQGGAIMWLGLSEEASWQRGDRKYHGKGK